MKSLAEEERRQDEGKRQKLDEEKILITRKSRRQFGQHLAGDKGSFKEPSVDKGFILTASKMLEVLVPICKLAGTMYFLHRISYWTRNLYTRGFNV